MEYRALGRTGMSVSNLTLGAMMLGAMGNSDREECVRIVHRALEAGITSINTADGYSAGQSEEIIGEALSGGRRGDVVLSVKTGRKVGGTPNSGGGSRRWFTRAIEGSLQRLRTDDIDVYELGRVSQSPVPMVAGSSGDARRAVEQQWRGLATRYDQHAYTYRAGVHLAAVLIWLRP